MEHKQLLFFSSHTTTLLAYTEYKICVKSCIAFVKILFESSMISIFTLKMIVILVGWSC